ncbi:facilitated trehalose transporter Tret1-like [Phymastichus coffea]|uniref:facilitated trehalose transporter Tret1-like n=1 Tax=Phymastichus coffea TaxID=108790 RepID=UPI00273B1B59|nr:facilitated trehalose transporter Tret1-like [Phymastichus coffea]XP_058807165.1 facilitated trehalose transporter Tret1-like [Phymastichus coffea]XP_058807166.1 facilitated trehalose transporter Tret1-like [Phymastichus coffea]
MEKRQEESYKPKRSNLVQWIATFTVFLLMLQMGIGIGWASPNNARLLSEDSPIQATPSNVSWMTSLVSIGSAVGAVLTGVLIEYVGTRRTNIISLMMMGISWTCLLLANSIMWIYVSRLIFGIAAVILFCCFSMYLGEVSDPRIRGTLIAFGAIGNPVGIVMGIVTETYLNMTVTSSIYLTLTIMNILLFFWLDDSPYYLVKKGYKEAAQVSLAFYRGASSEKELKEIMNFVENSEGFKDKLKKLKLSVVRKSIFVIMLVFALPQLGGYMNVMFYMEIILKSAKFEALKPEECVIYANIITVIAAFSTFPLIDKLGRRFLLIISSVGTAIALFALGLHFYLVTLGHDAKALQWLPITSLVVYLIAYPIGYGSVPGVLLSEMFPENIKSIAVCAASLSASSSGFLVVKAYQPIIDLAGEAYAFWIHSILSIVGVPCTLFLIMETKGKSFREIQDKLSTK